MDTNDTYSSYHSMTGQITEALVDTANETQGIGRELGEQFARAIVEKHSIDAISGDGDGGVGVDVDVDIGVATSRNDTGIAACVSASPAASFGR